jgi:steroid delta-isomerase-like uncharacterized protein
MANDDLSVIPELFADDYVYHSPGSPDVQGPDGLREMLTAYRAAFPDFLQTADLLIAAEGDTVVSCWNATGTHEGKFLGIPPTGKRVTFTRVVITRLAGGKVVEDWELVDSLGLCSSSASRICPGKPPALEIGRRPRARESGEQGDRKR